MKLEKNKKIGILGGTFNPIHMGHLMLAEYAYDSLGLDKVLIMPSGVSYLKADENVLPAKHRIEMVNLAISGNQHFELSKIETEREGNTYTYETLLQLKSIDPDAEYYYIVGEDTLFYIDKWKEPGIIFDNCIITAARRNNIDNKALTARKAYLEKKFSNAGIVLLDSPNIDISSTMIRMRVADGKSIRYYVPKEVEEYIFGNRLYR